MISRVKTASTWHGVLLVDKPSGLTSHDVVGKVRRALGTREVGHSGTLDPMATGLLVVLVGHATRLASYLTAEDKTYEARVLFGVGTTSQDADGAETERVAVPEALLADFRAEKTPTALTDALAIEIARASQIPPQVSAIHVDGKRAYDLAREGHEVALAARPVSVRGAAIDRVGVDDRGPFADVTLTVTKGYYVRAFARDLGAAMGLPAHLTKLRRGQSGALDVRDAVSLEAPDLATKLVPIATAARLAMACVELTEEGSSRAKCGKSVDGTHFATDPVVGVSLWLYDGAPVAIGSRDDEGIHLLRGFPT